MKQKYILIFIFLLFLSGCSAANRAETYLLTPSALGMEGVAPRVFVNKDMSLEKREQFSKIVSEAKIRIAEFYGEVLSQPEILACSTEECFVGLGAKKQRGLHLGKSKILLSPRGLTIPILTHEWSHAELATRMEAWLDGVFGIHSIPTWFNEGLAVVVSEEPAHSEKVWEHIVAAKLATPNLEDLVSLRQWKKAAMVFGDVDHGIGIPGKICVVYATAGHEVRKWHQRVGRDGLLKLIEKVKSSGDFERSF